MIAFVCCSVRRPTRCEAFKVTVGATTLPPAGWREVDVPRFGLLVTRSANGHDADADT